MDIQLTDPNIAFLVSMKEPIQVNTEGYVGKSGMSFTYKDRGAIIL